jgi:2-methylcitrate dehydratase PrpD
MSLLRSLGDKLATLDPRGYCPADRAALEHHILDSIAASIIGATTPDGRASLSFLAHGLSGPLDEVSTRVASTRVTEFDDIHLASGTTPGSIVVPTALTVGGILGLADSYTFAGAVIAGYEAMTRLGAAIQGQAAGYRGIWATYFTAPFAASAVTARLLGLNGEQTAHALAIALTMSAGRAGPTPAGRTARWLLAGEAARAGCKAALAASDGYLGDLSLLDGKYLATGHDIEPALDAFNADWRESVLGKTSIKPYCSAKQVLAAIAGFEQILGRGIAPGAIERIRVLVPRDFVAMTKNPPIPGNRISSIVSAPYQLALAAHHPAGFYDIARDPFVMNDMIAVLMAKVSVEGDAELDAHLPGCWPASVEVVTKDRSETTLVLDAPGDPALAFGHDKVAAKFHAGADRILGAAAVADWITLTCAALEEDDDLEELQNRYLSFGR